MPEPSSHTFSSSPHQLSRSVLRLSHFASSDGYRSAVRIWDVPAPSARIVLLHGIISHGGWYLASCAHLAQAGIEPHFLERRGSGINMRDRGDVPRGWPTWLQDVESYLESLATDRPRLLAGISWGGKLAAAIARHRPDLIDGLALICPGLFAHQQANALQRAALAWLGRRRLKLRRIDVPLRDPALFTDEPRWRDYIAHDPFVLRQITFRFALQDLHLTRYATESPAQIRTPTLLMLAGRDRIVLNDRTSAFVQSTSFPNPRIVKYPQAAHTLEFEPNPAPYFHDLIEWAAGSGRNPSCK